MDVSFDTHLPFIRGLACPRVNEQKCHNSVSFHAHLHEIQAAKDYAMPLGEMINRIRTVGFVGRAYMIKYLMEIDIFRVQLVDYHQ